MECNGVDYFSDNNGMVIGKNEWISYNLVTWMGGGIYSIRYSGMVAIIDCGWNNVILLRITYYRLNFKLCDFNQPYVWVY
jgi:hypothetical protein